MNSTSLLPASAAADPAAPFRLAAGLRGALVAAGLTCLASGCLHFDVSVGDSPGGPVDKVLALELDRAAAVADPATPQACAERRRRVAAALATGVLVLEAGADSDEGRYAPDDDFYWLTGVDTPEALLVLEAANGELSGERLYLPDHDAQYELWNGPRLAPGDDAARHTGIADTRSLTALEGDVQALVAAGAEFQGAGERILELLGESDVELKSASSMLHGVQQIKDAHEIQVMRAVVRITEAGLAEAMAVALPGRYEFTPEAVLESGFRRRGASTLAFPSICGSGINTCYLHYRANERRMEHGELLVMDVGAKLHHYSADVTRTIPVTGRFTPRQLEVYTLVYEASREAAKALRPGATIRDADKVARDYLAAHGGYDKYFAHGVGHGLGLRVHDRPRGREALEPGMVVTIEPGIYIAEEALGVRIEDDYLITADGAELLSDGLPAEPAELEAFLAELRSRD